MRNKKRYRYAYCRFGNKNPVDDYVESKISKGQAKIDFHLRLLEEKGPHLGRPYAAYLRNGIWELRPGIGTEEYRLLFYFWYKNMAYFVHAVDRKEMKQKEINTAIRRMKEMFKYL